MSLAPSADMYPVSILAIVSCPPRFPSEEALGDYYPSNRTYRIQCLDKLGLWVALTAPPRLSFKGKGYHPLFRGLAPSLIPKYRSFRGVSVLANRLKWWIVWGKLCEIIFQQIRHSDHLQVSHVDGIEFIAFHKDCPEPFVVQLKTYHLSGR